jgi:hypothetical protein
VTIAQLLRLNEGEAAGTWLATAFVGGSVVVTVAGAIRFWRQQIAMVRGKVLASGWEMGVIIVVAIAVSHFFDSRDVEVRGMGVDVGSWLLRRWWFRWRCWVEDEERSQIFHETRLKTFYPSGVDILDLERVEAPDTKVPERWGS